MKNFLSVCFILLVAVVLAQVPQGINYQAVVRDNTGAVLANKSVGVKLNIRSGSTTGAVAYSETQRDTTNQFGLINLIIGKGTVVSGTFNNIQWKDGIFYTEVLLDATGGVNYQSMGAVRLLSVPYALYAASSAGINVYDSVRRTRIQFGEGTSANQLGISNGIHSKLHNDSLEWGFQSVYTPNAVAVMLYVYDTITDENQIVQLNPNNVAIRSRSGLGHETQLRIKADAGISIMCDTGSAQYFFPLTPPTRANQAIISELVNGNWRSHWKNVNPVRDTIFHPVSGSNIKLPVNYYSVISPIASLMSLSFLLPQNPQDGDMVEIKFEANINSISYTGGSVGLGAFTSANISNPYQKLKYFASDQIWH